MKSKILVMGLGNPLRRDDGIGSRVIDILKRQPKQEQVTLLSSTQIDLVHTTTLKDYDTAILIDAQGENPQQPLELTKLQPEYSLPAFTSHIGSIPSLLAITASIYGKTPTCYLLAVAGTDFEMATGLSAPAEKNVLLAVKSINQLINQLLPAS